MKTEDGGKTYYRVDDKGEYLYEFKINDTVVGEFSKNTALETVLTSINGNADAGVTVERLLADKQLRSGLKAERYVSGETGLPTVTDILEALDKRGLDPREQLQVFAFDPNVHTIGDLREGMLLPGIITNITAFGAFVDIGVKQDGLVHISQLADRYVASPADVVHLGQHVEVRVTGVDTVRGRIALSMRREA